MITYFTHPGGKQKFEPATVEPKRPVWVHGEEINRRDLDRLSQRYGFDGNILRDALDDNELPRVEVNTSGIYIFVRVAERDTSHRIVTWPLLLALHDNQMVLTASRTRHDNDLKQLALERAETPTEVMLITLVSVLGQYEKQIKRTARRLQTIRHQLRQHEVGNDDFVHFVTIEDNLGVYETNLTSLSVVVDRLLGLLPHDQEAIEDIRLYVKQLLVEVASFSRSAANIRNTYSIIANNTLNRRMKTLTALTVLIALPNVVYGMYGMNVGLPFQEEPWAYSLVVSVSALVIFTVYLAGRRLKIF